MKNEDAVLKNDLMSVIVTELCGNAVIPSKKNILYAELKPITNENSTKPKPDLFDGCRLEDINQLVRDDIYPLIIPTKHPTEPVAPNMFMEAKGEKGSAAVMKRQACYDGAYGARAMHSLQNYGEEPVYDNNAYTFSSTYHNGQLTLYSHHPTAPATPGGRPEYHMTQLRVLTITRSPKAFVEGVTVFRNARDLAGRYRDNFITAANTRAMQSNILTSHPNPYDLHLEEDPGQASAALDYGTTSTSFATTSHSTDPTSSKRSRQSHSPPSKSADSHLDKSRTRPSISRRGQEAMIDMGSGEGEGEVSRTR